MRALALTLVTVAALAGCSKKGQSKKFFDLLHCWEVGWSVVESCYTTRSAGECSKYAEDWFEASSSGVTVLDSNKAFASDREKCAQDAVRGVTVWNQLSAEDITDDMADAIQALQTAVKSKNLDAIRTARSRVRELASAQ